MAASPMEQFEVRPLIPIHVGGYDISFTNQALWMVIVVLSLSLFLTLEQGSIGFGVSHILPVALVMF
mgnify:CR=1 FL=1